MEKLHAPSSGRSPTIAPLARDLDGRAIRLPDGVVGWRIRRHTGGRPRLVLGENKQPMQFPLEYTLADVEEILPRGTYRLDAIDEEGNSAGVTVPITIPGLRNGDVRPAEDDDDEERAGGDVSAVLPVSSSDVRLVLEANVRATQMAFIHNERTLAIGMRMAETLREGVQTLTEAQSDWIKTLATSRGFFRNAPLLQLPAPIAPSSNRKDDEDEDEDDEEDDDEEVEVPAAPPANLMEMLMPSLVPLVQQLAPMLVDMLKQSGASGSKFDLRDVLHWGYSKKQKARAAAADVQHAAATAATEASSATPSPAAGAERPSGPTQAPANLGEMLAMLPPELLPKLMAARAQLTPSEQSRMMKLLSVMPSEDLKGAAAWLATMSTDEIVAFVRTELAKPTPTAPAPAAAAGEE